MKKSLTIIIICWCFSIFAQTDKTSENKQAADNSGLDVAAAMKFLETKEQAFEKLANINPKKGTPKYAAKDKEIKEIVEEIIDYRFIAEYVIGKKWSETPESKKEELFNKIKELFSDVYLDKLFYNKSYEKKYLEKGTEKKYLKGVPESIFITSEIQGIFKGKTVGYELVYHIRKVDGKYKVFDVELDTVSLARNYREQFEKSLKEKSVDELIANIDKKIKSSKSEKQEKKETKPAAK
ncbi:ABC transporter substrate-binding protein [bacterium]|nr:ABC transporter substrate-binding protein [bacterium]